MSPERCICNNGILTLSYRKNGKDILRCDSCELMTVRPLPDDWTLKQYYDENYISGRYLNRTKEYAVKLREKTFREWFRLIESLLPEGGNLLDIGCGDGTAMDVAVEYGFGVYGNDISQRAAEKAKEKWGDRVYSGMRIENVNLEKDFFDCITMFDFIEHTDNPIHYLHLCRSLLKEEGILIIATHDSKSILKKIMGRSWSYLNPEEHLNLFSKKTLKIFLEKAGFKIKFIKNVAKFVNFEFLYNELKWTSHILYRIFSFIRRIIPSKLWNASFNFYFGEILCVAVKAKR